MSTMFAKFDCTPRWRERLPEITTPTLVVHGGADPFFAPGNAKALAQEIPGATLKVLDGVGAELARQTHAQVAAAMLTINFLLPRLIRQLRFPRGAGVRRSARPADMASAPR
jgi:pimeloyl-ACP methyl ester carboxylesterase